MFKLKFSIKLTILSIGLLAQTSFGQTPPNTDTSQTPNPVAPSNPPNTTGTSTPLVDTSTNNQLAEIKDQLAEIKKIIKDNGKDETDEVANFVLKKFKDVQVFKLAHKMVTKNVADDATCACGNEYNKEYKSESKECICYPKNKFELTSETVSIDSVIFLTKDGYIVELQVVCGNKKFSNSRAPIALSSDRLNKSDVLAFRNNQTDEYIFMNEIFHYIPKKSYSSEDDYFVLTPKNNSHWLTKNVGINSIFDIKLYSDALGVLGGKANGLVQTDANLKQFIHRKNFFNMGIFLPFSYFKFNLNASKFDSKLGFTDSSTFNRSSLLQKSWLSVDISFNAIHGWVTKKSLSSYYGDFGCGLNLSNLAKSKDTVTTISYSFFLEPGLDLKIADNIGTNISTRFIWNYSPQLDFDYQQSERLFIRPNFGLYWNPKGNKASRVFGRVSYNVDTRDKKNNYVQMQIGYSIQLTSLVK